MRINKACVFMSAALLGASLPASQAMSPETLNSTVKTNSTKKALVKAKAASKI